MTELLSFTLNIGVALVMGILIGLERQYRQHTAGLRTNTLVCVGAALFISLTRLMGDDQNPTRIASYIVSGIGFLGGGVILREGLTVKGMNTAATLWCTAAVGALAGAGFGVYALIATVVVLVVHLGLRPVGRWVDLRLKTATDVEMHYRLRVVVPGEQEGVIRNILMRHVNSHAGMKITGISTQDLDVSGNAAVVADIFSVQRQDRALQEVMNRLNIEPCVKSVSWEALPESN
jgi:putative Mg2+ transporter-C (MgtC) family protein